MSSRVRSSPSSSFFANCYRYELCNNELQVVTTRNARRCPSRATHSPARVGDEILILILILILGPIRGVPPTRGFLPELKSAQQTSRGRAMLRPRTAQGLSTRLRKCSVVFVGVAVSVAVAVAVADAYDVILTSMETILWRSVFPRTK